MNQAKLQSICAKAMFISQCAKPVKAANFPLNFLDHYATESPEVRNTLNTKMHCSNITQHL